MLKYVFICKNMNFRGLPMSIVMNRAMIFHLLTEKIQPQLKKPKENKVWTHFDLIKPKF